MKRFFAVLLIALMVCTLTACDGGENTTDPTQSAAEIPGDAEKMETSLWTLYYDKVWESKEDDFSDDEDYCTVYLSITDGDDSYVVTAEIRAVIDDPENFRGYLDSYGFDAYEYAENDAYDLVKIGGVDCLMSEGEYWGEPCLRYFGRVEKANATVFVEFMGDYEDKKVDELLAGLTFNLEDIGNVDCPWPWNGEPFSAQDATAEAGNKTLTSKWIPFDECVITTETFDHSIEIAGDKAYILSEGVLKQYAFDGSKLTYEKDIELDAEYEYITADKNGNLWLSAFGEDLVCVSDGEVTASYADTEYVVMSPDGTWGISYFTNSACDKITVNGDSLTKETITFAELDTVSEVFVDESYIYACGYETDDSEFKVFVYDTYGNLQMVLAGEDDDSLGSITYMTKTNDGFIGIDGNMREVVLWDAQGEYVGAADDGDLFSTGYPWFCDAAMTSDGELVIVMTDDRADESAMELIAFTVDGF